MPCNYVVLFMKALSTYLEFCFLNWQQLHIQRPPETILLFLLGSTSLLRTLKQLYRNIIQGQGEDLFPLEKFLLISNSKIKRDMIILPT